jgi:putative ABC transport system permease protein
VTTLAHDLRGALRSLLTSPGLTLVAVLTIGVGIGLNTTMFSIVRSVLLRPLPFRSPDALVRVTADLPGSGLQNVGFSILEIDDLSERATVFEAVAAVWVFDANLTGGERPERIVMAATGVNYFPILGETPQLGRVLTPQDRADGFAEAVVLSDAAWRRLFGGHADAIGRQIRIDTDLYTIVGVMPPGFRHPATAPGPVVDVWSVAGFRANPFASPPNRSRRILPSAIARLRPGVSIEEARAAVDALSVAIVREHPSDYPADGRWVIRLESMRDAVVGNVGPLLLSFSAAVALVLLIGCANVSNLLLVRTAARHRELAVRLAIGASRAHLVRQLLTENLVLAGVSGIAGVAAVYWMHVWLVAAMPAELPRLHEIRIDWMAVTFAAVITLLTSLACGIAPALQAGRTRPGDAIAGSGRGMSASRRLGRLRTTFVVAQVALSLVLVASAGLLAATVSRLIEVDPGFDSASVTTARTWIAVPNNPALDPYRTPAARGVLARRLLDRLRELPGVSAAAMATGVPLAQAPLRVPVQVQGVAEGEGLSAEFIAVTPDYFSVLGIPVARGRAFGESDDASTPPVVILDEDAERKFFPVLDAVGRSIYLGRGPQGLPPASTVVGVVRTVKHGRLDESPTPHVYASLYQRSGRSLSLLLKMRAAADGAQQSLRRAVADVDPELPVFAMASLDETVGNSISTQRFSAQALTVFAVLALFLVIGGVYGVMAYAVTTRTREMGIRIAIGATAADLQRGVLTDAFRTSVVGASIGLLLTAGATRFIRGMLFGVSSVDARVFLLATLLLMAATLFASYLPARRAARTDPVSSLRAE